MKIWLALAWVGFVGCQRGPSSSPVPPPPAPAAPSAAPSVVAPASTVDAAAPGEATPEPADASQPAPDGMQRVPGGAFTMGADRGGEEDEHPAHTVTLPPFWLDTTEVTNAAYGACVSAGACKPNDAHIAVHMKAGKDGDFNRPLQPVVGVTWDDARAYCAYRAKRLPREAEFEKAVRDDDDRRYPWGNEPPTPERTVFGRPLGIEPGHGTTDDVGAHPSGKGPYGHDDLAGNVWEWMEDEYDPFAYRRPTAGEGKPGTCPEILRAQDQLRDEGKQGFTGSNPIPHVCEHVLRGGAWNYDGPGLRSTNRVHHPGHFRLVMTGFRCAKDASP